MKSACHRSEVKDVNGKPVCQTCVYECEVENSEEEDENEKTPQQKRYEKIARKIAKV